MKNQSPLASLLRLNFCASLLTLALLGSGCSSTKLPEYQRDAPASTERIVRDEGMEVSLDPFLDEKRSRQYFGLYAADEGIGIVFVRVANHTTDQTFLVEKKQFQLLLAGASTGEKADATSIKRGTAGGETTAMIGAAVSGLGGLGLMLGGSSMIAHATEVQRNFVGKEMQDQTLAPGQSMEGFIYFQPVPKKGGWNRGATLQVSLTTTKTHKLLAMTIPLSE